MKEFMTHEKRVTQAHQKMVEKKSFVNKDIDIK